MSASAARAWPGEQAPSLASSSCGALWLRLNGRRVQLRPSGALWLAEERALIVADLHLEKGSAYAVRGQLLPPYDTRATLLRLAAETDALSPAQIVLLGDSFHDAKGPSRLDVEDLARITSLSVTSNLVWIAGNHDAMGLDRLPGAVVDEAAFEGLVLRHEPSPHPVAGEAAGHLHPCAKVSASGRSVRRRCFATDGSRIILPAFGAYAGGLNLKDEAFGGLFASAPVACALGQGRVHPLPYASLIGD